MHDAQPESPDRTASTAGADSTAAADGDAGTTSATDGDAAATAALDGDAATVAPEAPVERPKSAYQLPTKQNTVLRNIIWAIVLTMLVVIVVAVGFFGVGSDLDREPLENSEVDVTASAERAQDVAGFPVAVPSVGEEWEVRSARFADGQSPRWSVQYTSPQGKLVTLTEEGELSAPMLSAAMPGASVTEETTLAGADCQVLLGDDAGAAQEGIACEGEGYGLIVHGAAERAELEELMSEAIAAIG
jgi:hypothetical protein